MEKAIEYINEKIVLAEARKMNCETQSKAWYFYDGQIQGYKESLTAIEALG